LVVTIINYNNNNNNNNSYSYSYYILKFYVIIIFNY